VEKEWLSLIFGSGSLEGLDDAMRTLSRKA
jgi:hypothetical protein